MRSAGAPRSNSSSGGLTRSSSGGNVPITANSRGITTKSTFSGGISARLTALPTAANGGDNRTISYGEDVTICVYLDERKGLTILEITDQQPNGTITLFCRYALVLITSISHANTKRGIAIEVIEQDERSDFSPTDVPPGPATVLVQLSFRDTTARERVITALSRAWQLERQRQFRYSSPSPRRVLPRTAPDRGDPQGEHRRSPADRGDASSAFDSLLTTVRMLQNKTRGVLTELRAEDETIFSKRDGEFNFGPPGSSEDDLKSWAFYQLKRRSDLLDAEQQLRQIQQRRAMRAAAYDLNDLSPRSRDPSPDARPGSRSGGSRDFATGRGTFGSPQRDTVCPHCERPFVDPKHLQICGHRKVRCKNCQQRIKARDADSHRRTCPNKSGSNSQASSRGNSPNGSESSYYSLSPPRSPKVGSAVSRQTPPKEVKFAEPVRRTPREPDGPHRAISPTRRTSAGSSADGRQVSPASSSSAKSGTLQCPHCFRKCEERHIPKCSHRPTQCKRCGQEFAARDKARHEEVCAAKRTGPSKRQDDPTSTNSQTPPATPTGSSRFKSRVL